MSKVIQPAPAAQCQHEWVSGDNEYVSNASVCTKCALVAPSNNLPAPAAQGDREAFERWAAKRHGLSFNTWADTGKYSHDNTNAFWECWQAAIAYKGADK